MPTTRIGRDVLRVVVLVGADHGGVGACLSHAPVAAGRGRRRRVALFLRSVSSNRNSAHSTVSVMLRHV